MRSCAEALWMALRRLAGMDYRARNPPERREHGAVNRKLLVAGNAVEDRESRCAIELRCVEGIPKGAS